MNLIHNIIKALGWIWHPVKRNAIFILFMYILGIAVGLSEVPNWKGAHVYENIWFELFTDLYLIAVILSLIPDKIRRWFLYLIYIVAYTLAIIDVFCWVKFSSAISPSMLLLVGETTGSEASEFLSTYVTPDLLVSNLGWVFLILLCHILVVNLPKWGRMKAILGKVQGNIKTALDNTYAFSTQKHRYWEAICAILVLIIIGIGWQDTYTNKKCIHRFFQCKTVGDVEKDANLHPHAEMYQPVYRLAYSVFSNNLVAKQLGRLMENAEKIEQMKPEELGVDTCQVRSENIVVIIGESYNKYHSQLYGYDLETTPEQMKLAKSGRLTKFTDVITPWNLTSFVFKHLMTTYCVGDEGDWCDYPLFCQLFRKAGYQVNFLTNQFLPHAKDAIYDFSGGFFLNDEMLSSVQFDVRNEQTHLWDEDLLKDYQRLIASDSLRNSSANAKQKGQLTIYHMMGQHVNYRIRCPKKKHKFFTSNYDLPQNTPKEVKNIAYYDCATWYNDSVIGQIVERYKAQDAIIIFFADHGEEVYGPGSLHHCGRNHTTNITANIARNEYEIPMWIYCTEQYSRKHPDVVQAIRRAKDKPFMTDAMAHLLLGLTGKRTKYYRPELDPLSPQYDSGRKRLMQHLVEYSSKMKNENLKSATIIQYTIKGRFMSR